MDSAAPDATPSCPGKTFRITHSGSSRELPRSPGKHWRELREVKKINGTVLAFYKKIISVYNVLKCDLKVSSSIPPLHCYYCP
jgi:hypothetical protein